MILIKGSHIQLDLADDSTIVLPRGHGIIHDPDGESLHKCEVLLGPYKPKAGEVKLTSAARAYFGSSYQGRSANIDIPSGDWRPIGEATEIRYKRPAGNGARSAKHAGMYFHPFKKMNVPLFKSGSFYRLALPNSCIYDDRGFVFP